MSKYGFGLFSAAGLRPRQLIAFALASAVINGIVTASVGAWLAQTYASWQRKTAAIQTISDLVYERRTRAGMVMWAIKRGAETDELRYRKRAYDESFVAWNKKVQHNIFMIRDISGQSGVTRLETQFQDMLVSALADTDRCITKAYDVRLKGQDAAPILDACKMNELHQFTLDCAASFTNELDRLTRLSFLPWAGSDEATRKAVEARIDRACTRPASSLPPAGPLVPAPSAEPMVKAPEPPPVTVPAAAPDTSLPAGGTMTLTAPNPGKP
jgi:hypothetical protein